MAVSQAIPITRHPFANGSYKQMLIDGKWVDAASGKRFETHNPATGELLATVAEGDKEDIDRAVAAARRAFEGPWSKVKPFERQELLARLRALLRRRPPKGQATLAVGDLKLNPDTHEVTRGERTIDLTQREFELLEYLMRNERIVISRQRLLDEVWGYDPFSMTNTIEVFVSNLRRKLEAGGEARLLHTIRGAGYVLRV